MFTQLTSDTYQTALEPVAAGVLLFYKKLCPHCKNMEKVLEKFSAQRPDVNLFSIDIEEEESAAQHFGAERAPTIVVVKNGKPAAVKAGLMNPREMKAFFENAS